VIFSGPDSTKSYNWNLISNSDGYLDEELVIELKDQKRAIAYYPGKQSGQDTLVLTETITNNLVAINYIDVSHAGGVTQLFFSVLNAKNTTPDTWSKLVKELNIGETYKIPALVLYNNDPFAPEPYTGSLSWTSSQIEVGTVSAHGLFRVMAQGLTEVTAQLSGLTSNTILIKVLPGKPLISGQSFFNPAIVARGRATTLQVFVTDPDGNEDIRIVAPELSALGITPLTGIWDTQPGQLYGQGRYFTLNVNIPVNAPVGKYQIEVTTTDSYHNNSENFTTNLWVIEKAIRGDINADNTINLFDAIAALKHTVNPAYPANLAADTNGDGQIGIVDARNILKYVVGKLKF